MTFTLQGLRDGFSANGYADAIKPSKEVNPLVEIVVLSSKETFRETVKAIKAGASDYLTYPIHPAEVRRVVESPSQSLA